MDCPKSKKNTLTRLPDDAMVEILACAPIKSIYRSKCVAKAWRDLIDDPLNRRKLPQTLEGFFSMDFPICKHDSGDMEHCSFINYLKRSIPLDIDPCFSFLMMLPEIDSLYFADFCYGLLLFENCRKSDPSEVLSYIVCNPATKHWGIVPIYGCCPRKETFLQCSTFLAFNPAVSSQFHLIQFLIGDYDEEGASENQETLVHTYSSKSGMWSSNQTDSDEQGQLEGWRHPDRLQYVCPQPTFVNGIMHLIVVGSDQDQIVSIDVLGKTRRMMTLPAAAEGSHWKPTTYIGQSQGHLHYINSHYPTLEESNGSLSIWVLQDYDRQEWVLKDTVSFLKLFGRMTDESPGIDVVVIHPDCNVVFFLQPLNKLIAYDMHGP